MGGKKNGEEGGNLVGGSKKNENWEEEKGAGKNRYESKGEDDVWANATEADRQPKIDD